MPSSAPIATTSADSSATVACACALSRHRCGHTLLARPYLLLTDSMRCS
ncbi:hypothetical protein [Nonomuraea africana]